MMRDRDWRGAEKGGRSAVQGSYINKRSRVNLAQNETPGELKIQWLGLVPETITRYVIFLDR